ncbi:MAG: DUF4143 domain-containing protein [Propionibacteriaceae bacterium]|nr:DUF4143 domain-containing protein [Propionibacteriaceae bacterium]
MADAILGQSLEIAGAVVVRGPKACGKTTTAERRAASALRLDVDRQERLAAQANPMGALSGATPRLIDEWQLAPDLWNAVRAEVDRRGLDGQFILTGSATPSKDASRHTGAMRFSYVDMRPLTLVESGVSSGAVSLGDLWEGGDANVSASTGRTDLTTLADALCRGGWPSNIGRSLAQARAANHNYVQTIIGTEIVTLDGVRRDPRKVEALIFALARNSASYVTLETLARDTAQYGASVGVQTLPNYLDALARLWLLVDQPAWGGHLRSSANVRKSPKRHLVDPSLAVAALGAGPEDLLSDHEAFGQLLESLAFRDLSVYGQARGLSVRAYQDNRGSEIDLVLVRGVEWAGIEVKLSGLEQVLDSAAAKLVGLAGKMTTKPRFLAVLTAVGPCYTRADGVHVLSLTDLTV